MLKTAGVVFEDEWILVVDKYAGVVVNRAETTREPTLQDDLADYFGLGESLGIGDRAGIVHRLDRETSGLLVVAKTKAAFENLQVQFKRRQVDKEYLVLVHGHLKEESGTIARKISRIGKFGKFGIAEGRSSATLVAEGREAVTDFEVLSRYLMAEEIMTGFLLVRGETLSKARSRYLASFACDYTYVRVLPKTGRTHQIRVHLKSIGHPVVSDLIYCPRRLLQFDLLWCPRLFLHASRLEFMHPATGKSVTFELDLPKDLKNVILSLATSH